MWSADLSSSSLLRRAPLSPGSAGRPAHAVARCSSSSSSCPVQVAQGIKSLPRFPAALIAGTLAWSSLQLGNHQRRGRLRCRPHPKLRLHAVVEGGPDVEAARHWLRRMIIGHNLCPWARPAEEDGAIRIVASDAKTPEAALADLKTEAEWLAIGQAKSGPAARTTLLVCPEVQYWWDNEGFCETYADALQNGEALVEEYGFKVVAFHPGMQMAGTDMQPGDQIVVPGRQGGEDMELCGVVEEVEDDGSGMIVVTLVGRLADEVGHPRQMLVNWMLPVVEAFSPVRHGLFCIY
eukprot:TRINITY_DN9759_c0_g1_i2.p1 TRINITY_DN9759_c0_g1~~TRINITY_DN9759_c0_g1_i2.p1  ORF type:complete len:321 (-),score=46.89 TRINITY_DN9759_c0_g1_i2:125-1003(-)